MEGPGSFVKGVFGLSLYPPCQGLHETVSEVSSRARLFRRARSQEQQEADECAHTHTRGPLLRKEEDDRHGTQYSHMNSEGPSSLWNQSGEMLKHQQTCFYTLAPEQNEIYEAVPWPASSASSSCKLAMPSAFSCSVFYRA